MTRCQQTARYQAGISYVEVLVATLLILATLLPMMNAMYGASQGAGVHEGNAVRHAHVVAKMEEVLAEPYSSLLLAAEDAMVAGSSFDQPSRYSDPPGSTNRRLVYLSLYDGDNADGDDNTFTGVEARLMWIRAEIEDTSAALESLVHQ